MNGGAYSEPRAKMLMKRLFEAIKHLHDRNIVHRGERWGGCARSCSEQEHTHLSAVAGGCDADLKPENLLLRSASDDTEVKVADFGVAKTLGFEGLKTFCGSPQYFGALSVLLHACDACLLTVALSLLLLQPPRCCDARTPSLDKGGMGKAPTCGLLVSFCSLCKSGFGVSC